MSEKEPIDPDLKEKACLAIADEINNVMRKIIEYHDKGEKFKFRSSVDDLRDLFDVFREYCMVPFVAEGGE